MYDWIVLLSIYSRIRVIRIVIEWEVTALQTNSQSTIRNNRITENSVIDRAVALIDQHPIAWVECDEIACARDSSTDGIRVGSIKDPDPGGVSQRTEAIDSRPDEVALHLIVVCSGRQDHAVESISGNDVARRRQCAADSV